MSPCSVWDRICLVFFRDFGLQTSLQIFSCFPGLLRFCCHVGCWNGRNTAMTCKLCHRHLPAGSNGRLRGKHWTCRHCLNMETLLHRHLGHANQQGWSVESKADFFKKAATENLKTVTFGKQSELGCLRLRPSERRRSKRTKWRASRCLCLCGCRKATWRKMCWSTLLKLYSVPVKSCTLREAKARVTEEIFNRESCPPGGEETESPLKKLGMLWLPQWRESKSGTRHPQRRSQRRQQKGRRTPLPRLLRKSGQSKTKSMTASPRSLPKPQALWCGPPRPAERCWPRPPSLTWAKTLCSPYARPSSVERLGTRKQLKPGLWWKEAKAQGPRSKSFPSLLKMWRTSARPRQNLLKELHGWVQADRENHCCAAEAEAEKKWETFF